MSLTKKTVTDKAETVKVLGHYCIQVREAVQVLEDGELLSQKFHRYVLNPDHDVSSISDPVVLAQFNAVMSDSIKANYQAFLEERNAEIEASE